MDIDQAAAPSPPGPVAPGLVRGRDGRLRCAWHGGDPLYLAYHDGEWGWPVADDVRLFEKLCLEGFQAGLSWLTVLRKRENFRAAFAGFVPARVAAFGEEDVARLLGDPGIVRHEGKIRAAINNARRLRAIEDEFGSLAAFCWQFEPGPDERPRVCDHAALGGLATTPASIRLARALRRRGFAFVGPTTAYAFMQAMGLVNDHLEGCFVRPCVEAARRAFLRPAARAGGGIALRGA